MGSLRKCFNAASFLSRAHYRTTILSEAVSNRFNAVRCKGAYEGDGKTHTIMLNDDTDRLMINSYSELGFTLNNGITLMGPIAIFPTLVLSWNVGNLLHVNKESLSLFLLMEPKLDILILGLPQYRKADREVLLNIASFIRKYKIQVEVLPTEIACPTFNFLSSEERFVGAGIVPPIHVSGSDTNAMTAMAIGAPGLKGKGD